MLYKKLKTLISSINIIIFIIFLVLTFIIGGAVISSNLVDKDLSIFGYNFILTKDLSNNDSTNFVVYKKTDIQDFTLNSNVLYKLKSDDISVFAKFKGNSNNDDNTLIVQNLIDKQQHTIKLQDLDFIYTISFSSQTIGDFIQFVRTTQGLSIIIIFIVMLIVLFLFFNILIYFKLKKLDDLIITYNQIDKNLPKINHII